MLIIPLEKSFDWKKPPVVTLLLVALNCCVFLLVQHDDDRRVTEALEYYLESHLPRIELPLYLDTLHARSESDRLEDWEMVREYGSEEEASSFLLMHMQSDDAFMRRLRAGELIAVHDPNYEAWVGARARFDELLGRSTSFAYGFTPAAHEPLTLLSYMFLHGDFGHLLGNMVFLLLLGLAVELALGWRAYLGFYFASGLGAVLLFWAVYPSSGIPLVGASGAIAGLMGLYALLFGTRRIRFFYWVVFYFDYVKAPAIILFPLWIANELYQLLGGGVSGVAYVAHIGGLLVGGTLAVAIKRLPGRVNTDYLDASERSESKLRDLERSRELLGRLEIDRAKTVLRGLHRQHPGDREILLQLYRAEKFTAEAPQYHEIARRVLALSSDEPEIVQDVHDTFCDYVSTTGGKICVAPAQLAQLAIRFSRRDFLETAERIVANVLKLSATTPGLEQALLSVGKAHQRARNDALYRRYLKVLVNQFPKSPAAAAAREVLER